MPLNPAQLAVQLARVFTSNPPSAPDAAQQIAGAYATYAAQAIAVGAVPCPLAVPGATPVLVASLLSAMTPSPAPQRLELALAQGIQAFWMVARFIGPPLAPSPAPTVSAVITFPGPGPIIGCFSTPVPSPVAAAQKVANAAHAYTMSAIVASNAGPLSMV